MNSHPPATPKRFSLLSFRCTLFPYSCRPSGFQMARSCQSHPIPGEDTTENLLVIMLVQFFKATLSQYLENIRTCWHLKKKKYFLFTYLLHPQTLPLVCWLGSHQWHYTQSSALHISCISSTLKMQIILNIITYPIVLYWHFLYSVTSLSPHLSREIQH